eukprot:TRINITY_DN10634_c0_g1_i1.p2 TRINITY_DN10634_c0_g1~~TRINITY_DN10634_c0_g1_i1.p2  ORF type:complete len:107 (-),score=8.67 TRINITY_DN10634_c0_g1_i1:223-543(-)
MAAGGGGDAVVGGAAPAAPAAEVGYADEGYSAAMCYFPVMIVDCDLEVIKRLLIVVEVQVGISFAPRYFATDISMACGFQTDLHRKPGRRYKHFGMGQGEQHPFLT